NADGGAAPMITKDLHAHSVLSVHQEKSLRDHELAKERLVTVGSAGLRGCGGTCSAPGGVFGCRRTTPPQRPRGSGGTAPAEEPVTAGSHHAGRPGHALNSSC